MNKIGFNIQAQGLNSGAKDDLLAYLLAARPTTLVVINDKPYAARLAASLPGTVVFHRMTDVVPGRTDDNVQDHIGPAAFWQRATEGLAPLPNLGVYANNEPRFTDDVITWCVNVAGIAVQAGRPVVVGNWSTGTPDEQPANLQRAAALVELSERYPEVNIGLHEYIVLYWKHRAGSDGRVLTSRPTGDEPVTLWFMGRWKFWTAAMPDRRPKFVITEWGFDDPHGVYHGQTRAAAVWKSWGVEDVEWFAMDQLFAAELAHYADDRVVGMTLFTYGHITPTPEQDWSWFDWRLWGTALALIRGHVSPSVGEVPDVVDSIGSGTFTAQLPTGTVLNFRAGAGTDQPVLKKIRSGDAVELFGRAVAFGGLEWEAARFDGVDGWFARVGSLSLAPVTAPPDLPDSVSVSVVVNGVTYTGTATRAV